MLQLNTLSTSRLLCQNSTAPPPSSAPDPGPHPYLPPGSLVLFCPHSSSSLSPRPPALPPPTSSGSWVEGDQWGKLILVVMVVGVNPTRRQPCRQAGACLIVELNDRPLSAVRMAVGPS
ncbi:hypothetical protein PBY51_007941 [Eleginops maclovinus]|uniref:Uncharacterized protein n=1 Tax=Eleginops maclovinus TaxID=56733 RepID=A0AAN7X2E4_ELEMC|nr:hypothetical protein PBY51_007941 [Eleginops maclovinus]